MGEVIYLDERRGERSRTLSATHRLFFFDVSCPLSYLTAERIERKLGEVEWVPVDGASLRACRRPQAAADAPHGDDPAAQPRRLVRAGAAPAARVARQLSARRPLRAARLGLRLRDRRRRRVRAGGQPARLLWRLRPRGPRDAGRGGRRRRGAARGVPERRRRDVARRGAGGQRRAAPRRAGISELPADPRRRTSGSRARADCWLRGPR